MNGLHQPMTLRPQRRQWPFFLDEVGDEEIFTDSISTNLSDTLKLDALLKRSEARLLDVSSVWPFDLFPDKVVVDENKVDFIYNDFFWTKHTFSAHIKNIISAQVSVGPLFAELALEVLGYETNPQPIRFLRKKDAICACQLIMGLIACAKDNVDFSEFGVDEVKNKVGKIGKEREIENGTFPFS